MTLPSGNSSMRAPLRSSRTFAATSWARRDDTAKAFPTPEAPDPGYFRQLDERIRYINQKGMTVDLLLAGGGNQLRKLFPDWEQRERYVRYLIARYAA